VCVLFCLFVFVLFFGVGCVFVCFSFDMVGGDFMKSVQVLKILEQVFSIQNLNSGFTASM
jgi:hypothetical protein